MRIRCCLAMVMLALIVCQVAQAGDRGRRCDSNCDDCGDFVASCAATESDAPAWDYRCQPKECRWQLPPAMIGDSFAGTPIAVRSFTSIDRLVVIANDLDAPNVLPGPASILSLSEPGPIGAFDTSLTSITQLQTILRAGDPIPGLNLAGVINADAGLRSLGTIAQIQAQLAATGLPLDVIALQDPPQNYADAVAGIFAQRNGLPGQVQYDAASSGALLQGGADTLVGNEDLDAYYFYNFALRLDTAIADAVSGGVGRMKIADGGSVLPADRVYLRFSNVFGAGGAAGGGNLARFMPGLEKTLANGLISVEVRAPFAVDASSASTIDGANITGTKDARFGNLSVYLKSLLFSDNEFALTAGLGVVMPTASDVRVRFADGTDLLQISNDSVHLQPFVGMMYRPSRDIFAHGFLQTDIAANGNPVGINTGNGLEAAGKLTDPNFMHVDLGVGAWIYRSSNSRGITGVVPTLEVHHTNSLSGSDVITSGVVRVGNFSGMTTQTNIVAGCTAMLGRCSQLTTGYAVPVTGGASDGSLQVMLSLLP